MYISRTHLKELKALTVNELFFSKCLSICTFALQLPPHAPLRLEFAQKWVLVCSNVASYLNASVTM